MKVTLNADMGESFGLYKMGDDEALIQYVDIINVECGFHAGDFMVMDHTVKLAKKHGVKVGAHPALPDLQGFGRREMKLEPDELRNCMTYQVGALAAFLNANDMPLNHIKPHGKLYGMTAKDKALSRAICQVALNFNVPIVGMKNTYHESEAKDMGVEFIEEFFSDLDYDNNGNLLITRVHGTVDVEKAIVKIKLALKDGKVLSTDGQLVDTGCDSICVHSDTKDAIILAKSLYSVVQEHNEKG